MEITGTIKTVLPKTTGKTKKGKSWTAQQYVLETEGDDSASILLEAFGQDNIDEYALTEGETVTVEYSPEVHEYGGRCFGKNKIHGVSRG